MRDLVLIAHNLRSAHNVGSLLRTCEGLNIKVYLTGYTPYPISPHDERLPHESRKLTAQIRKTALGTETGDFWEHKSDLSALIKSLKSDHFTVAALEQTAGAVELPSYHPPDNLAIIVGREREGIEPKVLEQTDLQLVIPMFGSKESFNVVQAAAMALYHNRFYPE